MKGSKLAGAGPRICGWALALALLSTPGLQANCLGGTSPVVIDLDGGGFHFTGLDDPVRFDIDADGSLEEIGWIEAGSGTAFLVLDRNGNGRIDTGRELFGSATPQPLSEEPHGFLALAVFDGPEEGGNGDGYLSSIDGVWESLQLWFDEDHDGLTDPGELVPVPATELYAVDLEYRTSRRRDRHDNLLRYTSQLMLQDDQVRPGVVDVVFVLGD